MRRKVFRYIIFVCLFFTLSIGSGYGFGAIKLVEDNKALSTIVISAQPTDSARLGALELQYHIKKITGVELPVVTRVEEAEGIKIFVGESVSTNEMGLRNSDFESQEYLIRFSSNSIILMGRDWLGTEQERRETGRGTNGTTPQSLRQSTDYYKATGQNNKTNRYMITLPGFFDDQGTCYAVYDFLERFCGIRWYGPTELNIIFPLRKTLLIEGYDVNRSPSIKYRESWNYRKLPITTDQWNNPTNEELALYWRRMRVGGEKFASNHSFYSYKDRFLPDKQSNNKLYESYHPEYFARGRSETNQQLCYTNRQLIDQVVKDARAYFDGHGIKGVQPAMGDYFSVVPLDNSQWCKCDECQSLIAKDKHNHKGFFSTGLASNYFFNFVNSVAREVRKTHPDKYISTLAYSNYYYYPDSVKLESNIAIMLCMHVRNYWAPKLKENDIAAYKIWINHKGNRIYVWDYYCFPMLPAVQQGWHFFPGFSAHTLAEQIKMYYHDGVRGVFTDGIGEQLDYYISMKLYDDPTVEVDALLDEFFELYFGSASEPMKRFYLRIEEIFSDSSNYPVEVQTESRQFHQTEKIAWKYLGTAERMEELGSYIRTAEQSAKTSLEKARVQTWKAGVWDYMVEGRDKYLKKNFFQRLK